MTEQASEPLSIVAVVKFNDTEGLVLNRPVRFRYELVGQDYLGSDGPFKDVLAYSRGGGRFKAFGGKELSLTMVDGSVIKVKDHWWSAGLKDHRSAIFSDEKSLANCYVFGSGIVLPEEFDALRATYTGCVYPYDDYRKILYYDHERMKTYRKLWHEEARRNALIAEVKRLSRENEQLRAGGAQ